MDCPYLHRLSGNRLRTDLMTGNFIIKSLKLMMDILGASV